MNSLKIKNLTLLALCVFTLTFAVFGKVQALSDSSGYSCQVSRHGQGDSVASQCTEDFPQNRSDYWGAATSFQFLGHRHGNSSIEANSCIFGNHGEAECRTYSCSGSGCGTEYGGNHPFDYLGEGSFNIGSNNSGGSNFYQSQWAKVTDAEVRINGSSGGYYDEYSYQYPYPYPYPYPYETPYAYQTPYGYQYEYEYQYQTPYAYQYQYEYQYQTPAYSYQTPGGAYSYEYQYQYQTPAYAYPYPTPYAYPTPGYGYPTPASPFNYSLTSSGNSNVTKTSGSAFTTNSITVTLLSGTPESVSLTLSGVPAGVTYSISNAGCSPTCNPSPVITFSVAPTTAAGTYTITVTGSPLNRQTTFNLVVSGNPTLVSCSASPSTALIGQTVTWSAAVSGGTPPLTYAWSGTNIPTSPPPNTNPFSIIYNTIGQKSATVTVRDADDILTTCPAAYVQINFDPDFEEF